jgi:hypothetical protein
MNPGRGCDQLLRPGNDFLTGEPASDLEIPPEPEGTLMPLEASMAAIDAQAHTIGDAVLRTAPQVTKIRREFLTGRYGEVLTVGSGDSHGVAEFVAHMMEQYGVPARPMNALEYAANGCPLSSWGQGTAGIMISSSGRPGDACEAYARMREELQEGKLTGLVRITDAPPDSPYSAPVLPHEFELRPGVRSSNTSELPTRTTTAAIAVMIETVLRTFGPDPRMRGMALDWQHRLPSYRVLMERLARTKMWAQGAAGLLDSNKPILAIGEGYDYIVANMCKLALRAAVQKEVGVERLGEIDHALVPAGMQQDSTAILFASEGITDRHIDLFRYFARIGVRPALIGMPPGNYMQQKERSAVLHEFYNDPRVFLAPAVAKPFAALRAIFAAQYLGLAMAANGVRAGGQRATHVAIAAPEILQRHVRQRRAERPALPIGQNVWYMVGSSEQSKVDVA